MYYDPKKSDANWYGGAQVRLHPLSVVRPVYPTRREEFEWAFARE